MANTSFPGWNSGYNWKVIVFINVRDAGFEDVWYYNNTGPGTNTPGAWADAIAAATALAQQRQLMLSNSAVIVGVRITALNDRFQLLGTNGASVPITPRDLGLPVNPSVSPNPTPDVSVQFNARTNPPGVNRIWESRGWSLGAVSADPANGQGFGVGATIDGLFIPFFNRIISKQPALFRGTFCIRGRIRVGALAPSIPDVFGTTPYPIERVGVSATGSTFTYTVTTPDPDPLVPGARIIVAKVRLKCGKGANGAMTILSSDTTTLPGKTIITTNNLWRCAGVPSYNSFGYLYGEQFGLYTIDTMSANRIGNRQTGKPNFTTRGRRPALGG